MAARSERFVDKVTELLESVNSQKVKNKIKKDMPQIISLLDEEKSASASYADAWSQAADNFSSEIEKNLPENYKTQMDTKLQAKLPDDLKANQSFVPIAVIICTQEPSEFFGEFNTATREMLANDSWDSYSFKSLYMLLDWAVKLVPSRPNGSMKKDIFRGLDTDQTFKKDQTISFGYFASFTLRRYLALGRTAPLKKKAGAKEEEEDGAENDDDEEEFVVAEDAAEEAPLTKTLLRVNFNPELRAMGLRMLSERGVDEREVLVMAEQCFQVLDIKKNAKLGFQVVILKPL